MEGIDQASLAFDPAVGMALSLVVGFLVFGVALDLRVEDFRRVLRSPRAPVIGLVAQFVVLPSVAFVIGLALAATPSIALGLMLVACCPGGSVSNYLTGVARGDVATSVSMTAVSTAASLLFTPLAFAFWASMNPATAPLLQQIQVNPGQVVGMALTMVGLPVSVGMLLNGLRPAFAARLRPWVRRLSLVVFVLFVLFVMGGNLGTLIAWAGALFGPVVLAFLVSVSLGWGLARAAGLPAGSRRAVALEVGLQNVGLAMGVAMAVFPTLRGAALVGATWGTVHLVGGGLLATAWSRLPVPEPGPAPAKAPHPG